jgi:putative nucleotidyltransferase with HDIG domain
MTQMPTQAADTRKQPGLDDLVKKLGNLPAFSPVLRHLMDILRNPNTSALDVAKAIMKDQALTTRLLRLVNSPFYGFSRRIGTVTEAILLLGFTAVRNLLVTLGVTDLFPTGSKSAVAAVCLWRHAASTAIAASLLSRELKDPGREDVFVAGLLHDVGKLVELQLARDQFLAAVSLTRDAGLAMQDAERQMLGFDHPQAGYEVAKVWGFPEPLREAIRYHHQPTAAPSAGREADLIHAADLLAHTLGVAAPLEDSAPVPDEGVWGRLGVAPTCLEGLKGEMDGQYREILTILMPALA